MTNKIKLCWKWVGDPLFKSQWLEACSTILADRFELFCEESERQELVSHGLEPTSPGEDWGAGSQYLLLAMLASGEAQASIWIDERTGADNASMQALSLARARLIPIGMEPAGAAAILSVLSRSDAPSSPRFEESSTSEEYPQTWDDYGDLETDGSDTSLRVGDSSPAITREAEVDTGTFEENDDADLSDVEWFSTESSSHNESESELNNDESTLIQEFSRPLEIDGGDSGDASNGSNASTLETSISQDALKPALPIRVVRALAAKALRKSAARGGKKEPKAKPQFGAKKKNEKE